MTASILSRLTGRRTTPPTTAQEAAGPVPAPAGVEVTGRGSDIGTGGMVTKLDAASIATGSGIPVVLTSAANVEPALAGAEVGTWFAATGRRNGPCSVAGRSTSRAGCRGAATPRSWST